ncbi:MAG TPA: FAD-dependent oxidoreductase [Candidatus Paceibacterota bacterium]
MKIRVTGAGWYGSSIALGLLQRGHEVEIIEQNHIFAGASGANPARLHQGQHYPRSRLTRAYCQEHHAAFMGRYGFLTKAIPVNLYAVAEDESLVDFGTYTQILRGEIEFITVHDPAEFGLAHCEGAILTGERHIVIRKAREFFEGKLSGFITQAPSQKLVDWEVDCTFCARDSENIDRYEACLTVILEGPTDRAVTIMDGPFPSLYPWDEERNMNSLTSAKLTPIKRCGSYLEARGVLDDLTKDEITARANAMLEQISHYWPQVRDLYGIVDYRLGIRAMPKSAADARLVDIVRTGENKLRVRAGKIDAVIHAEQMICSMIGA